MFGLLLTLLILDGVLLVVVVLLQSGKGGGLAAMGGGGGAGTDNFMGSRQAATVLTRATWATGAVFLALALVLSILSSRNQEQAPLLQDTFQQAPAAPQPILPGAGEATGEGDAGAGAEEGVPGVNAGGADDGEGDQPSSDQ